MANMADFSLKAKGSKKSLETLREMLVCETQDRPYFFIYECDYSVIENDTLTANGICKWSAYSCFFKGEHTYYDRFCKDDSNICNIQDIAKELNLEIEIFGNELGMDFAEYYKISSKGELIAEYEISNLSENAIDKIAKKFSIDKKEISDFIDDEDYENDKLESLYDDDFDDYVFNEHYVNYPANYAVFDNGIEYEKFTL